MNSILTFMHEVGPISEIGVAGGVGALGGLQTGVTIDASRGPLSATACGAVGSVVVGSMADEYVACQLVRSSAKWSRIRTRRSRKLFLSERSQKHLSIIW